MSRRQTVQVNVDAVESMVKSHGWKNRYFSETLMGKIPGWVSDWKRNKYLPSPEEAARMCAILNAMPEEFLTEQEDINTVTALIHDEIQKGTNDLVGRLMFGQKESALTIPDEDALDKELISLLRQMDTPEKVQAARDSLQLILKLTDR